MKRARSIARRLLIRLLLAFALAPLAAVLVLSFTVGSTASLRVDPGAETRADAIARMLHPDRNGGVRLEVQQSGMPLLAGARFTVFDGTSSGPIVRWPEHFKFRPWELDESYETVRQSEVGLVRVVFAPDPDDWQLWLHWLKGELTTEMLPLLLLMMAVILPLGWLSVRASLGPVRLLAAEAAAIEPGQKGSRLSEADAPAELLPLVSAINASLKRIEQGFAAQRRFSANAAHELRTPLAALAARLEDPAAAQNMPEARRELGRMARLVDQLLTISELSGSGLRIDATVDLVATARETVAWLAPSALEGAVELALDAPAEGVWVRGNAAAIGTALRNLLENAVRYSPRNGRVIVRVLPHGPSLEVADQGPGIATEMRQAVFEPFWRGEERHGSAGLGLAIVKEMADLHAAKVSVRQNFPRGSVFRVEFAEIATACAKGPPQEAPLVGDREAA